MREGGTTLAMTVDMTTNSKRVSLFNEAGQLVQSRRYGTYEFAGQEYGRQVAFNSANAWRAGWRVELSE